MENPIEKHLDRFTLEYITFCMGLMSDLTTKTSGYEWIKGLCEKSEENVNKKQFTRE